MVKKLMGILAISCLFVNTALAAVDPVKLSDRQSLQGETVIETQGNVSVYLKHIPQPEQITVFHPNGQGKISDRFSPYAYQNIVDTTVFHLIVENSSSETLQATNMQIQMLLNGMPKEYLGQKEMSERWRKYYSLNTNTVTGAPDFMEQERAIIAEKYIESHAFTLGDIPPGGKRSGYIAVEKIDSPGSLRIKITNLQSPSGIQAFAFAFSSNGQ